MLYENEKTGFALWIEKTFWLKISLTELSPTVCPREDDDDVSLWVVTLILIFQQFLIVLWYFFMLEFRSEKRAQVDLSRSQGFIGYRES